MTAAPWKVAAGLLLTAVLALLVAVVSIASARNEARRARDTAVAAVGVLAGDLAQCRGNTATLESGIEAQNKAVADLAKAARTLKGRGEEALRAAQATTGELKAQNGVLQEIIRNDKTGDMRCDI
jgi:uncharacterized protein YlxW (UPF0749 family)